MLVSFGFVSTALNLYEASPAKTMTFATYEKRDKKEREAQLLAITKNNLQRTLRVLHYCVAHELPLYRMSSSIVPLATHPDAAWDFLAKTKKECKEIERLVKKYNLRTSMHPNQYTLFTSPRHEVTVNAVKDLQYHYDLLKGMGIEDRSYINIHVGGAYGDKKTSLDRFYENIKRIPSEIKSRMTFENDDKTFTTEETLQVCEKEGIPLMFDYHHYKANPGETPLEELLPRFVQTWKNTGRPPKVHLSSPKDEKAYRSHHDFVNLDYVLPFFKMVSNFTDELDVMIEAKQKDRAALQLIDELERVRGFKRMSGGTIFM
ncbi:UV DNA damage repair endonuclease UvsE [Fictibacillus nanhaiensis]|uniref:UV DNA damage repair endonuclease UvsE n=1 Tax=Fictibacillus nanhaiensis TaxID=742169 RepID=UPI001C976CAD|nr:UV DNA damage repair endonuclease UvsE [Fictibacillus nanhaiensis]MBY6037393.1 UV DNA damage repair endonuclease UvsE [Fictibacillus nanhaiensis]